MNTRSLLSVLSVGLLSLVPVAGLAEVPRSQALPPPQVSQSAEIDQLIQELKSPDPKVRSSTAVALGNMGESAKAAVPSLIPLIKDEDKWVRSSAAVALGNMGKLAQSAIPSLIPLLNDQEDYIVRSSAAEALKKLGYQP